MDDRIRQAAKEIVTSDIDAWRQDSIDDILDKFFAIMRKYGIKQGTLSEDGVGRICDNIEWTICRSLFIDRITNHFYRTFMFNDVPEDLQV